VTKKKILVIDDDNTVRIAIKHALKDRFEVIGAKNADEMKATLLNENIAVALVDMNITVENEGLDLIQVLKQHSEDMDIIVISSNVSRFSLKTAMDRGASAWLVKDFSTEQLSMTIDSVLYRRELLKENQHFEKTRARSLERSPILGVSQSVKQLGKIIEKVRRSSANVLITGETGTGKELVARHIGASDGRAFVAVDSSTITSTMAESLLFGHEKGAFTGAISSAKGLFEEADGGVIYFDEIGNMPLDIQSKLLRVIQEKEVLRVGSRKPIQLDFRVIAATNRNLEDMCKKGEFKYDLYQRLNVIPISLDPLKSRTEDIDLLIDHFLKIHSVSNNRQSLSADAMNAMRAYDWPGNVRELSNTIAFLCTMNAEQSVIEVEDLPNKIRVNAHDQNVLKNELSKVDSKKIKDNQAQDGFEAISSEFLRLLDKQSQVDFYQFMQRVEGYLLKNLVKKYPDNISKLSRAIKVSRSHLYAKLNSYGLEK
jgi:DNA-binding NtrC family response regulator